MHDEVSDTENIRKNLAIERMIVEGCDILLDTSQTFIRQGKTGWSDPLLMRSACLSWISGRTRDTFRSRLVCLVQFIQDTPKASTKAVVEAHLCAISFQGP
jgi:hypothetical protein